MSLRLNRIVTWSCELELAGLTALHDPLAMAAYSPPGALSGGVACTVAGGLGSETYSQAALAGGVAGGTTRPFGHSSVKPAPIKAGVTRGRRPAFGWKGDGAPRSRLV